MDLLTLAAKLTLDKSEYDKGMDEAEDKAEETEKKFGGKFGGVMDKVGTGLKVVGAAAAGAAAAAGTATVAFVKQAVGAYAEYQQLWGGVQKLYGAAGASFEEYVANAGYSMEELMADGEANIGIIKDLEQEYNRLQYAEGLVAENAKKAYATAGMSANEYMETATQFSAALITSLGGDTVEAARLTDVAMRAISDNYNTFGSDMESITNAFKGFAKQNYTMLDNLKLG